MQPLRKRLLPSWVGERVQKIIVFNDNISFTIQIYHFPGWYDLHLQEDNSIWDIYYYLLMILVPTNKVEKIKYFFLLSNYRIRFFWRKKNRFMANKHKLASMRNIKKIVLAAILKRKDFFFLKCYFSNVNLFMFFYFEPNFIE